VIIVNVGDVVVAPGNIGGAVREFVPAAGPDPRGGRRGCPGRGSGSWSRASGPGGGIEIEVCPGEVGPASP